MRRRTSQRQSLEQRSLLFLATSGHVGDVYVAEDERVRLAARVVQAVHARRPELAETIEIDVENAEARRDEPDVRERDAGELAAPAERQRYRADERQDLVAQTLAGTEAAEGVLPHAVGRVGAFRLGDDVIEAGLNK